MANFSIEQLRDNSPEPLASRRGGILPDIGVSFGDDGQIVVNENKIVDDADSQDPHADRGRPQSQHGGMPFDFNERVRTHLLGGPIPTEPVEFINYLNAMAEAVRDLRRDGPGALAGQRQQLGLRRTRMAMEINGFEIPENDAEADEAECDEEGSRNATLAMIGRVLDGLDKAAGKGSDPVKREARQLLRTIVMNAELALKRKQRRDNGNGDYSSNSSPNSRPASPR
jgi:hypothetical protein